MRVACSVTLCFNQKPARQVYKYPQLQLMNLLAELWAVLESRGLRRSWMYRWDLSVFSSTIAESDCVTVYSYRTDSSSAGAIRAATWLKLGCALCFSLCWHTLMDLSYWVDVNQAMMYNSYDTFKRNRSTRCTTLAFCLILKKDLETRKKTFMPLFWVLWLC